MRSTLSLLNIKIRFIDSMNCENQHHYCFYSKGIFYKKISIELLSE